MNNYQKKEEKKDSSKIAVAGIIIFLLLVSTLGIIFGSVSALATTLSPTTISHTTDSGESHNFNFRITPNFNQDYTIFDSSPFTLTYQSSFSNQGTFVDVPVNLTVPQHFSPGVYTSKIFVQGQNETDTVEITTTVPEDKTISWELSGHKLKNGNTGELILKGKNEGNVNVKISLAKTDRFEGKYNSYTAVRGQDIEFPLFYRVADNETLGSRNSTLIFTIDGVQKTETLSYEIVDGISPTISLVSNKTVLFGNNVPVKLNISDNLEVSTVTYSFLNQTHNAKLESEMWNLYFNNTNTTITDITTNVTVTDIGGNVVSELFNIKFGKDLNYNLTELKVIEISKNRAYLQEILVFENSYETRLKPIFNFTPDSSGIEGGFEMFIETGGQRYSLSSGSEVVFPTDNPIVLGITSNNAGFLSGTLTFQFDDFRIDDINYDVGVRVGDQDLYKEIKFSTPYRNSFINGTCSNDDNGFFDCNFKVPTDSYIGSIPGGNNPVIFSTEKDLNEIRDTYQDEVDKMRKSRNLWMAWSFLFMFGLVVVLGYVLYLYITKKEGYKFTEVFNRKDDYDE